MHDVVILLQTVSPSCGEWILIKQALRPTNDFTAMKLLVFMNLEKNAPRLFLLEHRSVLPKR